MQWVIEAIHIIPDEFRIAVDKRHFSLLADILYDGAQFFVMPYLIGWRLDADQPDTLLTAKEVQTVQGVGNAGRVGHAEILIGQLAVYRCGNGIPFFVVYLVSILFDVPPE